MKKNYEKKSLIQKAIKGCGKSNDIPYDESIEALTVFKNLDAHLIEECMLNGYSIVGTYSKGKYKMINVVYNLSQCDLNVYEYCMDTYTSLFDNGQRFVGPINIDTCQKMIDDVLSYCATVGCYNPRPLIKSCDIYEYSNDELKLLKSYKFEGMQELGGDAHVIK